jgi:hypothetical protein
MWCGGKWLPRRQFTEKLFIVVVFNSGNEISQSLYY